MGQEQPLLRPGDPHITETSLLLEGCRIIQGAIAGKQSLLQTHQTDDGELQAFAAVQRHQGDPVGSGVFAVGITGERRGGQEALQITLLVLLLVLKRSVHQFLQVAPAFLSLVSAIGDQLADIPALFHHLLNQFRRGHLTAALL